MRFILSVILITTVYTALYANGDPVVQYSSINRVANPEPLSLPHIRIISERLYITHESGYNCFDVTYVLKNDSLNGATDINYGFPIDYFINDGDGSFGMIYDGFSESMFETGWCESLIKDVSFRLNDIDLDFEVAKESVREAGYTVDSYANEYDDSVFTAGINRRWFYTNFTVESQEEVVLNIQYKVYANSSNLLYTNTDPFYVLNCIDLESGASVYDYPLLYRYFSNRFQILYDFTPARYFGNSSPYLFEIELDFSPLAPAELSINDERKEATHYKWSKYASAKNLKPLNMEVICHKDIISCKMPEIIGPMMIDRNKYDMALSNNKLDISFKESAFISELVYRVDNNSACDIRMLLLLDNDQKLEYRYSYNQDIDHQGETYAVLVINGEISLNSKTLGYPERLPSDYESNSCQKVKHITLTFDQNTDDSESGELCGNIYLLDSRFSK